MKKRKCRFRQTLSILVAAGMIIGGINFSVLPVSAEGQEPPPGNVDSTNNTDVQALINTINELPTPDEVSTKTLEEQEAIKGQVKTAFGKFESLTEEQKGQLNNVMNKLNDLQNYFGSMEIATPALRLEGETNKNVNDNSDVVDKVYDRLVETIKKIAAGKQEIARVDVFDLLNTSGNIEDFETAANAISTNKDTMYASLLLNCQNELFWHDKTSGFDFKFNYTPQGNKIIGGTAIVSFIVSSEYRANADDPYTVDSQKISSANNTLSKAQQIVNENANKSDYEKLLAYKNAICDLVSYDTEAAKDSYTGSDAPFQMISVFDGDPNTNVVCEGYSKAFQYLCDLSTFKNAKCYTATGTMSGGTGAGPHMWNIVSIGSNNYLVDVTNCDEGTVGAPNLLFMANPTSGSWNETYIFANAHNISYKYDEAIQSNYGESILKLATTAYDPTEPDKPDNNQPSKPNNGSSSNKPSNKPNNSSSSSKPSSKPKEL